MKKNISTGICSSEMQVHQIVFSISMSASACMHVKVTILCVPVPELTHGDKHSGHMSLNQMPRKLPIRFNTYHAGTEND